MSVLAELRDRLNFARGRRPSSWAADEWRRWEAASAVESGLMRVDVSARLLGPRGNHALVEGHEDALTPPQN